MKMTGSVSQLAICILTLVIFTGATLTKFEKLKKLDEIHDKIERETGGRIESRNDTYQLSNHYYYTQEDFVNGTVGKDVVDKFKTGLPENRNLPSNITSNFKLKLYGNEYDAITVYASGYVKMKSSGKSFTDVLINLCRFGSSRGYIQLLNTVYGTLRGRKQLYNSINVPDNMIKTGVVVQLTPTEKYCSKETSEQACRDASTPDVECYWCDVLSVCTNAFDQYTSFWLDNDCHIAVMGEDNKGDSSSSTSNLTPTETTSTSPETSNQQLEATTKTSMSGNTVMSSTTSPLLVQNDNSSIALIIIISVVCLLVLLIVLSIWYWTRKKLDY
ncbi:plexin domain containing 2 precursor [Schistosoma japonicum]|nr:plexin domain containing 2 precursor [Schistosoma japonicum]